MAPMIAARKVEPDPERKELRILWADGHRSAIPYIRLRDECPCAKCRSDREGERPRSLLPMALTTKLLSWTRVGNYALRFSWGDSHSDGIFAYDTLRALCPCGSCGPAAGA